MLVMEGTRYRAVAFVPGEGAVLTLDSRDRREALEHAERWSEDGYGAVVFRVDGGRPEKIWPGEAA